MKLTSGIGRVLVGEGHVAVGALLALLGHLRRDAYHLVGLSAFMARGGLLENVALVLRLAAGLRGANMCN